jgi:hypothetical protein
MVRMTKLSPDNAAWNRDLLWFDAQIAGLDDQHIQMYSNLELSLAGSSYSLVLLTLTTAALAPTQLCD